MRAVKYSTLSIVLLLFCTVQAQAIPFYGPVELKSDSGSMTVSANKVKSFDGTDTAIIERQGSEWIFIAPIGLKNNPINNVDWSQSDTSFFEGRYAKQVSDTDLNLNGYKVINLSSPTADSDAATKKYVDANELYIVNNPPSQSVSFNSQRLTDLSTPTNGKDGANKNYVDNNELFLPDNPATSDVSLSGFNITDLAEPTSDSEAATKYYVDQNAGGVADGTIGVEDDGTFIGDFKALDFADTLSVTANGDTAIVDATDAAQQIASDSYLPNDPAESDVSMNGNDIRKVDRIVHNEGNSVRDFKNSDDLTYRFGMASDELILTSESNPSSTRSWSIDGFVNGITFDSSTLTGVKSSTVDSGVVNKGYVDNNAGSYLPDDPATSDVNMSSNNINDLNNIDMVDAGSAPKISFMDGTTDNYAIQIGKIDDEFEIGAFSINTSQAFELLNFDTADVGGAKITNVDTPTNDFDGATKKYVDDNSGAPAPRMRAHLPLTNIPAGDTASLAFHVPSGDTVTFFEAGFQSDTQTALNGVELEAFDLTNQTTLFTANSKHTSGSPLAEKQGAIDVSVRLKNTSGNSVKVSGFVEYAVW